nr:MAG TPA: Putative HNHc nuclease [Caudoviricetes sp.]
MYEIVRISKIKEDQNGTELLISIPGKYIKDMVLDKHIRHAEMRFDDGRYISIYQRKKAYATLSDIAKWNGDAPEDVKEIMKYHQIKRTGCKYFSLSDCTMDTAREYINTLMEFALENGVPLSDLGVDRTDDIGKYLYFCIKHKKCAVCGRKGEIHHVDTIGMGNDRRKVDDSNYRKICLCREHHTIAHQRGMDVFEKMYKVYGIVIRQ